MGNRQYLNSAFPFPIHDEERKTSKDIPPGFVQVRRPPLRKFSYLRNRSINFQQESICRCLASFLIPSESRPSFFYRRWMKLYLSFHYFSNILLRASIHGTGRTSPESSSRIRRSSSARQAVSESSSICSSKLSKREPAIAARASGGSFRTSSSRSLVSLFIVCPLS